MTRRKRTPAVAATKAAFSKGTFHAWHRATVKCTAIRRYIANSPILTFATDRIVDIEEKSVVACTFPVISLLKKLGQKKSLVFKIHVFIREQECYSLLF